MNPNNQQPQAQPDEQEFNQSVDEQQAQQEQAEMEKMKQSIPANFIDPDTLKKVQKEFGSSDKFVVNKNWTDDTIDKTDVKSIYNLEHFIHSTFPTIVSQSKNNIEKIKRARNYRNAEYKGTALDKVPTGAFKTKSSDISIAVDTKEANLLNSRYEVKIKPLTKAGFDPIESVSVNADGSENTPISRYELLEANVKAFFKKNSFTTVLRQVIDDAITASIGGVVISYNNQAKVGADMDTINGDIEIRAVRPESMFFDPKCVRQDLKDCDYVVLTDYVSIEKMKDHPSYGKIKDLINNANGNGIDLSLSFAAVDEYGDYSNFNPNLNDMSQLILRYFCMYRLAFSETLQRNVVLFSEWIGTDGLVVLQENTIMNIDELPVAVVKSTSNSNSLYTNSLVMRAQPLQDAKNILESLRVSDSLSRVSPTLILADSLGISPQQAQLIAQQGSGGTMVVGAGKNTDPSAAGQVVQGIRYLERQTDKDQFLMTFSQDLTNNINRTFGITVMDTMGDTGSAQTQGAMQTKISLNDKSDVVILDNLAEFKVAVANKYAKTLLANFGQRDLVLGQTIDESDEYLFAQFNPRLFENIGFDFVVDGKPMTPSDWQMYQQRIQMLYTNQQQYGGNLITDEEFADIMDLPNAEAVKLRVAQQKGVIPQLKAQFVEQISMQHAIVWNVVNSIYQTLSKRSDQPIAPFTPINQLPPKIQAQIIPLVQQVFMSNTEYAQQVDWNRIPFFLNDVAYGKYITSVMGMDRVILLQNELQNLQPQQDVQALQAQEQGRQQSVGKPSGANAPQPSQQM